MTQLLESRCGSRTPTLRKVPVGELDYGLADDVLSWVDSVGMTLFDWQCDVLRSALALRGRKWAAYEVDVIVPRQNGKNEILVALELAAVAVLGKRLVVHSAHEAATSAKHFARFAELAERLPEIEKLLPSTKNQGFYSSNGKEHISFRNGAVIDFKTRSRKAGRGFSADLVVLDEAFELPQKTVGSLLYTIRARRNPQVWKTSSAAHVGSDVLHNDRRRASSDDPEDDRFLYLEWGNERGCDPGDPETWLRSNPSVGQQAPGFELDLQTFRNEYASAKGDPDSLTEFVREVCGVPESPDDEGRVISAELWDSLKNEASTVVSSPQWSICVEEFDGDRRQWASIGVAGRNQDGQLHVGVSDRRLGTDWLVDRVVEHWTGKRAPVRIHKTGPEASFIAALRERGVEVVEVGSAEVAQATGQFLSAAMNGQLAHRGGSWLAKSLTGAQVRPLTDGGVIWSQRSSSVEITPLVACTVALGGVPQEQYAGGFTDLDDW
jgi:phage terminase large subunit-like protein